LNWDIVFLKYGKRWGKNNFRWEKKFGDGKKKILDRKVWFGDGENLLERIVLHFLESRLSGHLLLRG
jgi:hypothetical protein